MDICGSVAFVSGGSGGLGAEICRLLASSGAKVIVGYRRGADRAEAVCQSIEDLGHEAKAVRVDHTDPVSASECIDEIAGNSGGLDILINNAGMASGGHNFPKGDLDAFTPEIWAEMLSVNVSGPYFLTRAASPHLV